MFYNICEFKTFWLFLGNFITAVRGENQKAAAGFFVGAFLVAFCVFILVLQYKWTEWYNSIQAYQG